jgi:hypothetical protein
MLVIALSHRGAAQIRRVVRDRVIERDPYDPARPTDTRSSPAVARLLARALG